ncbi:MAG: Transcriptional regulator [Candidatus Adlerbacteria bacterium GW2011_GWB1_54_7]|uniref:Transcriptional regulator n=2 Tax=Candidatus Adleribacteriota TaxID=1752736 RepID=A0A0G1Y2H3_9BACT|nr:MAG: Transcriptional regulator [Candidatus Adlerbacteria bacterium GW2011_GWB1_54_7]
MAAAKKIFSPDGSPMISTRRAAERLHCAPDYIGKLCREGKLNGTLAEGTWFVELSSIAVFEVERRQLRAARAQKLSETRKEEALSYKFQNGGAITRLALRARRVAPSGAIVALCASLVMGVSLAFASAAVSGPNLSAAIAQINSPFFGPRIQIISLERASDGVLKVFSRFYAFFAPSAPAPLAQFPEDQGDAFKGDSLAREGVALGTKASPLSVPAKPSTIVQNSYPVRERVLERVVEKVSTGVSEDLLTTKLQELGNVLRSELYIGLSNVQAPRGFPSSGGVANNISITQVIDKLDNVTLTSATVRGLSGLSDSDVPDTITASNYLPLAGGALTGAVTNSAVATSTWSGPFAADVLNVSTSTATSTFANGIELAGGCFRLPDGTCAGSGGGVSGGTDGMLASWTGASSLTATSAPTAGYFVATSSTASIFPFASTTGITVAGTASTTNLNISNISACSGGNALVTNSSGVVSCGVITASGGTFPFTPTALGNSTSTLLQLNAGLIALASSTIGAGGQTTGLTVSGGATTTGNQYIAGTLQAGASTLSSLSLTFALSVADGGTGATTLTSGQLLYGAGTNAVQSVATSTLAVGNGLTTTSGTLGYQVGGTNASIGLAAINANSLLANVSAVSAVPTTLATSSLFAAGTPGNVLTYTSAGTWVPSATTTFSTGLTYANGNTTCDTSSSSVFGCLAAVDWSLFNNKISSSSLSAGTGISYNSSTGVISNTIGYPFPNNATTTQLQFNGGASTTLASVYDILYVGRDATTTIRGDGVASVIPFASSTALTVSGNFYGAGLTTCNTTADKLLWNSGIFSCGVDQNSGGAGSEINWTWFNGSGIRLGTTTNQIAIGATATATLAKVEVTPNGSNPAAIFFGDVGIGTSSPGTALGVAGSAVVSGPVTAQYFTATSTATASVLPFASSTALTVSGTGYFGTASTTNLNISSAATFQNLASGGLAVNASGAVYKAATTTFSTGLTYANGNTTCDTASSSVFGCHYMRHRILIRLRLSRRRRLEPLQRQSLFHLD